MSSYKGKCHCGQTEWSVKLEKDQQKHILCHCDTCKVLGGGAFTLNQIVPKSAISFSKGGDSIKAYTYKGDSGNEVKCYYCPNCTTHVYHHQLVMGPDTVIARTVLLGDDGKKFDPGAEIYGKAKMAWEKEVATTFELLPPS
ncbi:hypothetical protein K402DRAFT_460393 [Aulographum hederae CBS 113979]|uniref:CENP-V/GFA domain-containing protein n=1 Tax=Aulographum hederae CBS 113979 TaxID=1176131 RepID=A0A6G1HB51_9PEZI|nr:hypothetical protein K402DRAFT_460393 [Aulographum hederae CBS 113979]